MTPFPAACFFDLDGTLLDTLADLADAANAALIAHGLPTHSQDAFRYFVGSGVAALMKRALPPDASEQRLAGVIADMRAHYAVNWARKTLPYPGIPSLLETLSARGVPLAVLSNKIHQATQTIIAHFFPNIPFAEVRGQQPHTPLKPDPAAALEMAGALGLDPTAIFFIGDTHTDIETARNASMVPIGVTWGFRDERELLEAGAAVLLHRPEELLQILDKGAIR